MTDVPAAVNHGRWVGYCGADPTHALELVPGQTTTFDCPYCPFSGPVVWPGNAAQISAALDARPEQYRNWYPAGHPWASALGIPTGQSVADLQAETQAETQAAAAEAARRDELEQTLTDLGYVLDAETMTVREI